MLLWYRLQSAADSRRIYLSRSYLSHQTCGSDDDDKIFDTAKCIQAIRAGVKHLHSLKLAQNDLNPINIALDHNDEPVTFEFGCCRPFDDHLLSAGTPEWIDEDEHYTISRERNDDVA